MVKWPSKPNPKGSSMKHKLTVAACVVAVAVIGVLSVQAYNRYKAKHNAQAAIATTQQASKSAASAKQQAVFDAQAKSLQALCEKDLAAFNTLTKVQQAKEQAPNCSLQFVQ